MSDPFTPVAEPEQDQARCLADSYSYVDPNRPATTFTEPLVAVAEAPVAAAAVGAAAVAAAGAQVANAVENAARPNWFTSAQSVWTWIIIILGIVLVIVIAMNKSISGGRKAGAIVLLILLVLLVLLFINYPVTPGTPRTY
jgi:cell division protein FtsW (lipid II flippase)